VNVAIVIACAVVSMSAASLLRSEEIVRSVNEKTSLWKASMDSPFAHMSHGEVRAQLLGAVDTRTKFEKFVHPKADQIRAPSYYDPRDEYPHCKSMTMIRDQAWCGSCWAFGAVNSISDRYCIKEGKDTILSAEDMLACSGAGGCNGGSPHKAYDYWISTGVVTEDCYPYSFESCDHHIPNSTNPCPSGYGPTPECKRQCKNGASWESDKHKGSKAYSVEGVENIMTELSMNGPCETVIAVYEDFLYYQTGVYHHVSGQLEGFHAIKLMGYGIEGDTKYWLLANSWNDHWGEKGFFRMVRGNNECGVEASIVCGQI